MRGQRFFVLILLMAALLTVSACSTSALAPTDTPVPEATDTPTPEATDTPTPQPTATLTFTPWPTLGPTPEPTIPPTPAPAVTPTPAPTSPAQFCTGSDANRTFFLQAAHGLKFAVYCATGLPTGWNLSSGNYAGATLTLTYKYRSTSQKFVVQEGAFCVGNAVTCEGGPHPAAGSGSTSFDGMTGAFFTTTTGLLIAVNPGTKNAYFITSTGVAVSTLATFSANMKAVPKT